MKVKSNPTLRFPAKMTKGLPQKMNPFEVHINRSKQQVLGRISKSDRGLPGISKNKALQKRKNTLLQEYKMKGKNNQFIDQRIGERNTGMTEDDRIMARFTAERVRMFNKKAIFNLSESEVLTHRGQTLTEVEKFEETRSDDEEEDPRSSGALKGKFVDSAHFGGGMLTKNKKDRESLIDELINESKKRKAERQRNKEETLEATEELDEEWKTLGLIVTAKNRVNEDPEKQKKDEYDIVMRQLKFEPHGQASQRMKTEEEIAKEDKEHLEELEKERQRQLREIEAEKYRSYRSADDLDDSFSHLTDELRVDESSQHSNPSESASSAGSDVETDGEDCEETRSNSEHSDAEENEVDTVSLVESEDEKNKEESSDKKEQSIIDSTLSDQEDDGECAMDDLTDLMPSVEQGSNSIEPSTTTSIDDSTEPNIKKAKVETAECSSTPDNKVDLDIPYVVNFPDSFEAFKELLGNHSAEKQKIILDRLIKSNHPNLEPGNKKKMCKLSEYLVQLVCVGEVTWKALPVFMAHLSFLQEFNREELLTTLVDNITDNLDSFDHTVPLSAMQFLVCYILVSQRPHGLDLVLPISKIALNLSCRILSRAEPSQRSHRRTGLLCSCLLLQDAKCSATVYSEAVTFLHDSIMMSISRSGIVQCSSKGKQGENNKPPSKQADLKEAEEFKLNLEGNEEEMTDDQVLYCSVILLTEFVKAYRRYPQSKILFKSSQKMLNSVKASGFAPLLAEEVVALQNLLQVLQSASLPPLMKTTKKPKALRQYEPSFHTVTVGKSQKGLPAEKQEEQKLLHKYKHEMKGAMRELRRDRVFLANVKLKEKARSDKQRLRKVKEILGSAAAQQGELRSLKRKK